MASNQFAPTLVFALNRVIKGIDPHDPLGSVVNVQGFLFFFLERLDARLACDFVVRPLLLRCELGPVVRGSWNPFAFNKSLKMPPFVFGDISAEIVLCSIGLVSSNGGLFLSGLDLVLSG